MVNKALQGLVNTIYKYNLTLYTYQRVFRGCKMWREREMMIMEDRGGEGGRGPGVG